MSYYLKETAQALWLEVILWNKQTADTKFYKTAANTSATEGKLWGGNEIVQRIREPVAKSDGLNPIPEPTWWKESNAT